MTGRATFNAAQWLLDRHVDGGAGEAVCFRTGAGELRYAEVLDRVARTAGLLAADGIRAGDRVLLALADSAAAAVALLAVMRIGAVAVPVSPRMKPADYERIIADLRPHAAVVTAEVGPDQLGRVLAGHTGDRRWVDAPGPVPGARWLAGEVAAATATAGCAPTIPDDIALIQYTSGSTGQPRGVMHRHRALRAAPAGLVERLAVSPGDTVLSASKLAFGYGLGNSVLVPLSVGASSVLDERPAEPAAVGRDLDRHRPTLFFAVPTLYAALLRVDATGARFPIRSCRAYVSSGEHLSARLGNRCRAAFGPALVNVFGCTETLYSFAGNAPGAWSPATIGPPFAGYTLRPDPAGELWVRGPGVAAGYWQRQAETARTFRDGWVRTGDMMRPAGDGQLGHLGRTDDVINVGGLKVAPGEIEDVLLAHPGVAACAVVGVPDIDSLSRIVAFVVPAADAPTGAPDQAALRRHLRARLSPPRRPAAIELVEELPRTATGKTSRQLLRARAATSVR